MKYATENIYTYSCTQRIAPEVLGTRSVSFSRSARTIHRACNLCVHCARTTECWRKQWNHMMMFLFRTLCRMSRRPWWLHVCYNELTVSQCLFRSALCWIALYLAKWIMFSFSLATTCWSMAAGEQQLIGISLYIDFKLLHLNVK